MTSDHAAHADLTNDHGAGGHAADIDKHVKVYIVVFVALMALTLVTVGVSYLHLPKRTAIALAVFIAAVKGSLVAGYFMHLISEKRLIYVVLVITVVMFIALMALPIFTHSNGYGIFE